MRTLWLFPLLLAGCSTTAAQRPLQPVPVTVLPWNEAPAARAALAALQKKPYLRLRLEDPGEQLARRSSGSKGAAKQAPKIRLAIQQTLEQARQLYRQLRFAEAISLLTEARAQLGRQASSPEDLSLLSQVALQLGLNHLAQKDHEAASRAVAFSFTLGFPGPAPGALPPAVESFITEVRGQQSSAPRGTMQISTRPGRGEVFVDGRSLGQSPARVEVPPGLHHLRATRLGSQTLAQLQPVEATKEHRVELNLKPASSAELAQQVAALYSQGGDPEQAGEHLSRALGPDRAVLTVGREKKSLVARVRWTGKRSLPRVPLSCSRPAAGPLSDCLGPMLYQLAAGKPLAPARGSLSRPVYKRWWFWTAVAAGAVAAGTGIGLGVYYGTYTSDRTDVYIEK